MNHRQLGAIEELFFLMSEVSPANCCVAAEISGSTTVEDWQKAFQAVRSRHPLWSVCIRRDKDRIPTYAQAELDFIPIRILDGATPFDWSAEILNELQAPFDVENGTLLRAVLSVQKQGSILILTAHHSIADGLSLTYSIRDLINVIGSGEEPKRLRALPAMEDLIESPHMAQRSGIQQRVANEKLPQQSEDIQTSSTRMTLQRGAIGPEELAYWRLGCKRAKTTLHTALCVAMARAVRELSPCLFGQTCRVVSPVSRREALAVGDDFGLYIGVAQLIVDVEADFWSAASDCRSQLENMLTLDSMRERARIVKELVYSGRAAEVPSSGFMERDLVLSNTKILPFPSDLGDLKITQWGSAALPASPNEQRISATTVNDTLFMTYVSMNPLDGLLEGIAQHMNDAVRQIA